MQLLTKLYSIFLVKVTIFSLAMKDDIIIGIGNSETSYSSGCIRPFHKDVLIIVTHCAVAELYELLLLMKYE